MKRKITITFILLLSITLSANVILQYFESRWETIERRMPDIFMAGYQALWVPPNGVCDTGGYSVGYDVFDRFNLGSPYWQTLYGTEESYIAMVKAAHRAGKLVFADIVLNHNGFRDASTPGFVENGDYPGFICTLPDDVDGDFHSAYASDVLEMRLAGLIDIAQEKNHQFIRQPTEDNPDNIPYEKPNPANARFYPDKDPSSGDVLTPSGFNLTNPYGGDPYKENATGLLIRYVEWMNEVIGVDGFRIDAEKHIPNWFFNDFYDGALYQKGSPDFHGNPTTPFSFGEVLDGNKDLLKSYIRKDGYGNRDVLDFPLYFKMKDVFSGTGYGNLTELTDASVDSVDGNANDGTRGVQFVSSADDEPPADDNLAYAYILTRPGYPIVYFNAREFGTNRDFPKEGRGDALGGRYGNIITTLVDIHNEYARGEMKIRYADQDIYIYERSRNLVVGICDRHDSGYETKTIYVDIPPGTVLRELTGNFSQNADIPEYITVSDNWQITIKIPHNDKGLGYVMYGPDNPKGTLSISPTNGEISPDPDTYYNAYQRLTSIPIVTSDSLTVTLQTTDDVPEDNALIKLDGGLDVNGNGDIDIKDGDFAGFENFSNRSPRYEGGSGTYSQTIDLTNLEDGFHYITVVAFIHRPSDYPPIFNTFRKVFYLDRKGPALEIEYPKYNSETQSYEISSKDYILKLKTPDGTANSMHIFFDEDATSDNVNDYINRCNENNRVTHLDRYSWQYSWTDISAGSHTIAFVLFEESGKATLIKYDNFFCYQPSPPMELGYDANSSENITTFYTLPSVIGTTAFKDILIRVDKSNGISFPEDYDVYLIIDGKEYSAVEFNEAYKDTYNVLFYWDQNLSDNYDEFRFNWKGYGIGIHTFEAKAKLKNTTLPENISTKILTVSETTPPPSLEILAPSNDANVGLSIQVKVKVDEYAQSLAAYFNPSGKEDEQVFFVNDVLNSSYYNSQDNTISFIFNLDNPYTQEKEGFNSTEGENILKVVVSSGDNLQGLINTKTVKVNFAVSNSTDVRNWMIFK